MRLRLLSFALSVVFGFAAMATTHNVSVSSNQFTPANLTIAQGDTVIWTNTSGSHNVDGRTVTYPNNPASFYNGGASGAMWTFQHIFTTAGTYDYECTPHAGAGMVGSITVNAAPVAAAPCTQPFFSEYIEGSSNNKGFEIYNPSNSTLNLGTYRVMLSGNGGSFTNSFDLSGSLAPGGVYVVTTDQADPIMLAVADTALSFPSVAHFNGDDALFLMDTVTGDTLDIIGVVGVDPGSSWTVGSGATANNTLVRDTTVNMGETDWSVASTQWSVQPQNTYSFLGSHGSTCFALPCTQPFFSEYIEGSSNNKGFEVYNPSNSAINLGTYRVMLSGNGGSFTNSFDLSGSLAAGGVYVVTADQADPTMLAVADTALSFPSVAHFNGDDALFLMDTVTGDTLDIIGVVGVDPGSSWTVGTGSTANHTLTRDASVSAGETDWSVASTQWTVNPQNTFSLLGSHSSNCFGPTTPAVSFNIASMAVLEDVGSVDVSLSLNPTSATADTVTLQVTLGSNVNIPGDGSITPAPDVTTGIFELVIPAGADSTGFTISVADDAILEGNETLFVDMIGTSANIMMGATTNFTFVVEDNDQIIPVYDIVDVTGLDANFEPDSLGVECKLLGTVFTTNFQGGGISIYMHDGTDGINVFSFNPVPGYTPAIGDSIRAIGTIAFYNGLTEIIVDSIAVISTGNAIQQPTVVTGLNEATESELVRLNGFYLADASQWPAAGSNSNVDITNGIDTITMRIDLDTDIDGTMAPTSYFDVIGVGSQFDPSSPYDSGYQMFPRDSTDIIPLPLPNIYISEVMTISDLAAPLNGDWFEVVNNGSTPIDLNGFSWSDDSRTAGTHTITTNTLLPAGEAAVIVDVATADVTDWIAEWKQNGNNLIIFNTGNQFTGFSQLDNSGDEVNLYDPAGREVSRAAYTSSEVVSGASTEYDNNGMVTGIAVNGINGAYISVNGDEGSPGNMAPTNISVNEFMAENIALYPNPAVNYFVLQTGNNIKKVVRVTNTAGQLVLSVESTDTDVEVNTNSLKAGVYFINIEMEGKKATRKLVVK